MAEIRNADRDVARRSNRRTLVFLIILFGLPYLASFSLFFHPEWLPEKTLNKGDLITPVRPVAGLMKDLRAVGEVTDLSGHWSLLGIGGRTCADACRQNLYKMRQVRRALGVDRRRVVRYYLVPSDWDSAQYATVLPEYQGTQLLIYDPPSQETLWPFRVDEADPQGQVYIIDPEANLMMRYVPDAEAKGMLEDLQQLLKAAKSG